VEANALAREPTRAVLHAGAARPCTDHGWLLSRHSFATDAPTGEAGPRLGPLRVLNEVRIDPGEGNTARLHQDMEILVWVLDGALEHQDSAGNIAVIEPGDLARLRAGHGVRHSEYNASGRDPVRLLEFWIQPAERGLAPDYERRRFAPGERRGVLRLIASEDGDGESVQIEQQVRVYTGLFSGTERDQLPGMAGRAYYAHCARGALTVNGCALSSGDALELHGVDGIDVSGGNEGELLLFDVPAL
jgi:redox-sensitive bicupin YhaK (pirin superfamily)